MPETDFLPAISLLWPPGLEDSSIENLGRWGAYSIEDLSVDGVAGALSRNARQMSQTRTILMNLNPDPRVISYRQSILDDCLHCPDLLTGLEELLPSISTLAKTRLRFNNLEIVPMFQTVWRLSELELYAESIKKLNKLLSKAAPELCSEGFMRLSDLVTEIVSSDTYQSLIGELPNLRAGIEHTASITIGVNLDNEMRPVEATLISINPQRFRGHENTLLNRLMGFKSKDEYQGIAQLHRAHFDPSENSDAYLLHPLFRDLERVLKSITQPIADALNRYIRLNSQFLVNLEVEITFYIGAVRLIRQIQAAGLPMCRAEIVDSEERVLELEDFYNLDMALRLLDFHKKQDLSQEIVTNTITFGTNRRVFILTGPNRGGKTTYTQAIGLAQVLFQSGLYVPARRARISPVDGIYTHFPVEEKPQFNMGRLGEEAKRLSDIFKKATRNSLVLLNETLSTTSSRECLYLARDIVRALELLGVWAVYTTHMHELGETTDDSPVVSLVAGATPDDTNPDVVRRTYKINPAPPTGLSFAQDIARRFGISFEQLSLVIQERNRDKPI